MDRELPEKFEFSTKLKPRSTRYVYETQKKLLCNFFKYCKNKLCKMNKIITLQKCEVYADDEIVKKNFYFFFIFLKHFFIFD